MNITQLTLKLIIMLIPGGIGSIILERLTIHKPWSPFKFITNSIIIGVFSYLLLNIFSDKLLVWDSFSENSLIPYNEVRLASLCGIFIGFLLTIADTYKLLNLFAKKLKISNKYGDENLFSFFLWSRDTKYVYIRYIKHDLTYCGYIESYSETDEIKELVLSDVAVYNYSNSDLLYEVDKIYLSLPKDEIIIEVAKLRINEQEQTEN